jgi:hypothetical protein
MGGNGKASHAKAQSTQRSQRKERTTALPPFGSYRLRVSCFHFFTGSKSWEEWPHPLLFPLPRRAGEGLRELRLIPTRRDYITSPRQVGAGLCRQLRLQDTSPLFGFPSKVIWIRRGNCRAGALKQILKEHHLDIERFHRGKRPAYLILA